MLASTDRRSFLKSAAVVTAVGVLAAHMSGEEKQATVNAGPNPDPGKPVVIAPPNACDCHAHIVGPTEQYPFVAGRSFTPAEAHLDQYRRMLAALGLTRAVIVQPSFYGTDNRRTLDAVLESGGRWRGIAGLDSDTAKSEIERLNAAGFRGARVNLSYKGGPTLDDVDKVARLVMRFGWHMQIQVEAKDLAELVPRFRRLPTPVVIDHMGRMTPDLGVNYPGFKLLLKMIGEGNGWVKLSSAYVLSRQPYPHQDLVPIAKALIEAGPERVVWGSNWPHPSYKGNPPIDATQLDLLAMWASDMMRKKILVDNPAKLYGFETFKI